jgi:hypothetical protein
VQKRRAAARQAGNEDRRRQRPRQDRAILPLRVRQDQKRREHPLQVGARRKAPERRQRRFSFKAHGKGGQRFDEAGVGERPCLEARGLDHRGDQGLRRKARLVLADDRACEPVHSPGDHCASFDRERSFAIPASLGARESGLDRSGGAMKQE